MNGKLEGSRVDEMNGLKIFSSDIAKSCICTRLRDVFHLIHMAPFELANQTNDQKNTLFDHPLDQHRLP